MANGASVVICRQACRQCRGGVTLHKGSHFGLGAYIETSRKKFETHEIAFTEGDMLYMFSDGYVHQFGGPQNKKLKTTGLIQVLNEIMDCPPNSNAPGWPSSSRTGKVPCTRPTTCWWPASS